MVGIDNDADVEVSVFVFAKQMRHFPPNKGLWLGSKSLPHSLQMLDKSSTWWTLEWWRSSSIVRKVLLQTPHVNPGAAVDVAVSPRKYKIGSRDDNFMLCGDILGWINFVPKWTDTTFYIH